MTFNTLRLFPCRPMSLNISSRPSSPQLLPIFPLLFPIPSLPYVLTYSFSSPCPNLPVFLLFPLLLSYSFSSTVLTYSLSSICSSPIPCLSSVPTYSFSCLFSSPLLLSETLPLKHVPVLSELALKCWENLLWTNVPEKWQMGTGTGMYLYLGSNGSILFKYTGTGISYVCGNCLPVFVRHSSWRWKLSHCLLQLRFQPQSVNPCNKKSDTHTV
jgi:hypothetical protein